LERATAEVESGLPVQVYAPESPGSYPVVVLLHGGAWLAGEPEDVAALAEGLAERGIVVFNGDYRTMTRGGRFPGMAEDVACVIDYARHNAARYTDTPDRLAVVGHSAGAHLGALVSLAPSEFRCPTGTGDPLGPDSFVGLAGPYDITRIPFLSPLFGGSFTDRPQEWERANPLNYVDSASNIPILLIHGDADTVAPLDFSQEFEDALVNAGADSTLDVVSGADHQAMVDPSVTGDLIASFVRR
jgi:acetyl esterase/lipase